MTFATHYAHRNSSVSLAITDGTRLASCSWDHTVRLWDAHTVSNRTIGDALVSHTNTVTVFKSHICCSPDGTRLASCSSDHTVRFWDAHTGSPTGDALVVGHTKAVFHICFSSDGTRLASYSWDHTVRLWDAHTGCPIGDALVGHTNTVFHICFSSDGTRLASCSNDDIVMLLDAHTRSPIGDALVGDTNMVNDISPDRTRLVTISPKEMILWNLSSLPIIEASEKAGLILCIPKPR